MKKIALVTLSSFLSFFFLSLLQLNIYSKAIAADTADNMGGLEIGELAKDFNLRVVTASGEAGDGMLLLRPNNEKYLIVEFFSSWCGGCQENLPNMFNLVGKTAGYSAVKAVSLDRNESDLLEYMGDHQQEFIFTVFIDSRRVAAPAYKIKYIPTTYLLDENNKVLFKKVGTLSEQEVNFLIDRVKR